MPNLDPTVRLAHRPETVQLDAPAPECTLSVLPYGAHLTLLWTHDQARTAYVALGILLGAVEKGNTE
jgi:hypothetical protein